MGGFRPVTLSAQNNLTVVGGGGCGEKRKGVLPVCMFAALRYL